MDDILNLNQFKLVKLLASLAFILHHLIVYFFVQYHNFYIYQTNRQSEIYRQFS